MKITPELIKETMEQLNKKPFVIFVSPNERQDSIDELSRYGNVVKTPNVGENQVILVKRSEIEDYLREKVCE